MGIPRILLTVPLSIDLLARLQGVGEVIDASREKLSEDQFAALASSVDAVAVTAKQRLDAPLLCRSPRLRVIASSSVGLDHIDVDEATRRGIAVCNAPRLQDEAVAEMALGLLFALARNLFGNDAFVRNGQWTGRYPPLAVDIGGKHLGLLGMGGIGRHLARIAGGVGLKVAYFKPTRDFDAENAGIATYMPRSELFQTSDFLSLHLPLNELTRHSVGCREFKLMKRGSFLINTARGALLDEDALIDALNSGRLAGAALDVMTVEPLPADSPLRQACNLILQPHAAGRTSRAQRLVEERVIDNLVAALSDCPIPSLVNPGYREHV